MVKARTTDDQGHVISAIPVAKAQMRFDCWNEKKLRPIFLISKKSDGAGVWAQVARATIWSTNHYTTPSLFDGLLHVFSYKEVLITKLKH